MSKGSSAMKYIQAFLKKKKTTDMVVNDTKIYQKMKNKFVEYRKKYKIKDAL